MNPVTFYEYIDWIHRPCGTLDDVLLRLSLAGLWMTIVNKKAPEDRGVNDACCLTAICRLRLPTH